MIDSSLFKGTQVSYKTAESGKREREGLCMCRDVCVRGLTLSLSAHDTSPAYRILYDAQVFKILTQASVYSLTVLILFLLRSAFITQHGAFQAATQIT